MSYQDQTQAQSAPFSGDPAAFWQSSWAGADHHHHHSPPDTTPSLDHRFKRPRTAYDKPSNFQPPQHHPRINPPPPMGARGTSQIFFKTRMCAKFVEGTCRNGDLCTFAHGLNDLRDPPPNWQEILREKERNSVAGNHWSSVGGEDDRRPLHRFKICMKYYNGEECPYGERCNFVHERGPSQQAAVGRFVEADVEQRESMAISGGAEGRGSGGGELEQRALWRTRVCSKWETGHCPYGDRCHYAHGQSELRSFGNGDEPPDQVWINACSNNSMSRNLSSVAVPPVNLATPDCKNKDSKWKLTKKINRIYADWLDDADLPNYSGNQDY